jgi:GNAT superfamily N-acetyltransferase
VTLSAPRPLAGDDSLEGFVSGVPSIDEWLKRRARANQESGATRTFLLIDEGAEAPSIAGYYALASGAVAVAGATDRFRRNMPEPIPVAVLARLAVHQVWQGQGVGRALFRDAALRVLQAAETLGIRGLVTHAISEDAKAFYLALGFAPSPLEPMTLMVTLADLRLNLGAA